MESLELQSLCGSGSGTAAAAAVAAARRASHRHGHDRSAELLGGEEEEDDAEEDYEDPEEMFNDAGIPFEPFHLRREREEGYFDEVRTRPPLLHLHRL